MFTKEYLIRLKYWTPCFLKQHCKFIDWYKCAGHRGASVRFKIKIYVFSKSKVGEKGIHFDMCNVHFFQNVREARLHRSMQCSFFPKTCENCVHIVPEILDKVPSPLLSGKPSPGIKWNSWWHMLHGAVPDFRSQKKQEPGRPDWNTFALGDIHWQHSSLRHSLTRKILIKRHKLTLQLYKLDFRLPGMR